MTALRKRLIEDIQLRNFSPHTVEAYVRAVSQFSRHYGRSPDQLSGEQVRQYLLYLVKERQVSWSLYNQTRCALQFFYRVTLGRDEWFDKLPCASGPNDCRRCSRPMSCAGFSRWRPMSPGTRR